MPVRTEADRHSTKKYFYATGRRFEGACQNHGVWPCRKHIHSGGTRLCVLLSERGSLALESGGHRPHTAEFRPDNGHIRLHTLDQAAGGTAACHLLHGDNRCQGGKNHLVQDMGIPDRWSRPFLSQLVVAQSAVSARGGHISLYHDAGSRLSLPAHGRTVDKPPV